MITKIKNIILSELSIKKGMALVFINSLILIGSVFIINGFLSRYYGLDALGEFLLVKRIITSSVGVLLIGTNIGLPHYLSKNSDTKYGHSSFLIFLLFSTPSLFILLKIFNNSQISSYLDTTSIYPYFLFGVSILFQSITYSLFRGNFNMVGASFVQFFCSAVTPLLCVFLFNQLLNVFLFTGLINIMICFFFFFWRNGFLSLKIDIITNSIELIKYGSNRIIGIICQFILIAGVPILISYFSTLENVAYFNSSYSLFRLSLLVINPIGMILLPQISKMIHNNELQKISHPLTLMMQIGILISFLTCIYLFVFAESILDLWLGNVNSDAIFMLRMILFSLPAHTIAGLARSPIDAHSEKGHNSIVYGLSVFSLAGTFILTNCLGLNSLLCIMLSFNISQLVAGLSSFIILKRIYNIKILSHSFCRDILFWSLISIAYFYLSSLVFKNLYFYMFLSAISGIFLIYLFFKTNKSKWLEGLRI